MRRSGIFRNFATVLAIAAVCAAAVMLLWQRAHPLGSLEISARAERVRSTPGTESNVVSLITIGDASRALLEPIGTKKFISRSAHIFVLKLLRLAGAKVIVFDLAFRASTREDAELKQMLAEEWPIPTILPGLEVPGSDTVGLPAIWPEGLSRTLWLASTRSLNPDGKLMKFQAARPVALASRWLPFLSVAAAAAYHDPINQDVRVSGNRASIGKWSIKTLDNLDVLPSNEAFATKIPTIELASLFGMHLEDAKARFGGRVVIIGESSLAETHTSLTGPTLGSEFVARMTHALLQPKRLILSEPTDPTLYALLLLLAVLGGAVYCLGVRESVVSFGAGFALAALVPAWAGSTNFVAIPDMLPIAAVITSASVGLLARVVRQSKFLPWFANRAPDERIHRMGTYLFVDIQGSSQLAHEWGADRTSEVFASILKQIAGVVEANGGVVERLLGDGLLAGFFGADESRTAAAIASIRALRELNLQQDGRRIGLTMGAEDGPTSGQVVRTSTLIDWSNFGETIHVAARLQSACSAMDRSALIGPRLAALCQSSEPCEFVAETELKGLGLVKVFTVL